MDSRSCLITLIHEYDTTLRSRLSSVIGFVDSWVLVDFTASKELPEEIAAVLDGVPGTHLSFPFAGYDAALNAAMHEAAQFADFMVYLAADERLQMISERFPDDADRHIYLVEVKHQAYSEWLPRLIPLGRDLKYAGTVSAALCANHQIETKPLLNTAIEHISGSAWQQRVCERDRKLMAQQLASEPQNAALRLSLARLELQANRLDETQALLEDLCRFDTTAKKSQRWLSCYLLANIKITQADMQARDSISEVAPDYQSAMAALQDCIEIDPNRAEPYMRLIALLKQQGNLSAALGISELIVDLDEHPIANYVEPNIQRYLARLELADIHYQLEDIDACREVASSIKGGHELPQAAMRKIKYLADAPDQRDPIGLIESIKHPQPGAGQSKSLETQPKLTIGMATYDDFDGVYFSVMSILLYHPEVLSQIEIVIVDNNPSSAHGESVKALCRRTAHVRYVEAGEYKGTTIRERVFIEAKGKFVMCMDCHVFMHAGTIAKLLEYCEANQDSLDLIHGPMIDEDLSSLTTHMEPQWNEGFYGRYKTDLRAENPDAEPFDIPMQGMGLFVCRKDAWLGFNHRFRGFGGEEGYIHEKFRRAGGRVLCLPFLRWTHRFFRPDGTKYSNIWEDRIRNYLIGWHEVGLDVSELLKHFAEHVGPSITATAHALYKEEQKSPFWPFADIYCLVRDEKQQSDSHPVLAALSIEKTAQFICLSNHNGSGSEALSHILVTAKAQSLAEIVLIDLSSDEAQEADTLALANTIRRSMETAQYDLYQCSLLSEETSGRMPQAMLLKNSAFDAVSAVLQSTQTIDSESLRASAVSIWPSHE